MGRRGAWRALACAGLLLITPSAAHASTHGPWTTAESVLPTSKDGHTREVRPRSYRAFRLNHKDAAEQLRTDSVVLPTPDGRFHRFTIRPTQTLSPGLARQHPEISTYAGTGVTDATERVTLDLTPLGLHASVSSPDGTYEVTPYYRGTRTRYAAYNSSSVPSTGYGDAHLQTPARSAATTPQAQATGSSAAIRTYRIAVANDPTFATYYGSANVLAAKVTIVNRLNQIWERDFAAHMTLVANTATLNFDTTAKFSGSNGPCGVSACFTNAASCGVNTINRSTTVFGQLVGAANYDIGTVLYGTGGNGIAYVGVVGWATYKGGTCSGSSVPGGDGFIVDLAAHELGHGFGANHTFSGTGSNCAPDQWASGSTEPGSGQTIMSYAGICDANNNLQGNSDGYFSQQTIAEVQDFLTTDTYAAATGSSATVANSVPVVSVPANATIPIRTPFTLTGSATDADAADSLSYLWEQNDGATAQSTIRSNTRTDGPLFAVFADGSHAPSSSPSRTFPDIAQVVSGDTDAANGTCSTLACFAEFLPNASYNGPLHFRLTVRDGNANGGGIAHADTTLTLARTAGPFRVTSQSTATTLSSGQDLPVTWSVAGTDVSPVSVADVSISLSTDGGLTYPTTLEASTPNDGSQTVILPAITAANARIRVAAVGNVFFDVNHAQLTIGAGVPSAINSGNATVPYSDTPALTVSSHDTDTAGSALTIAAALPSGLSFTPTQTTANDRTWALAGQALVAPGSYPVTATVSDGGGHSSTTTFTLTVTPEAATVAYTGDTSAAGALDAATAPVHLAATVTDGDGKEGDRTTATATFRDGTTTLCANVAVSAGGEAVCDTSLSTGSTHQITVSAGGRYTGSTTQALPVSASNSAAPVVDDNGVTTAQYSDALGTVVTATDADSAGGALTALVSGLPAGITLTPTTTAAHSRSWTTSGLIGAAPGSYPATVTVRDDQGHETEHPLTFTVTREDVVLTPVGDGLAFALSGTDATDGDLSLATVTVSEGAVTLCPNLLPGTGLTAVCLAVLLPGTHHVTATAGGRYTGTASRDVVTFGTPTTTTTPPPTASAPVTTPIPAATDPAPAAPAAAILVPNLARTDARLRLDRKGRVRTTVGCRESVSGTITRPCHGTVVLTTKVKGRTRTIAKGTFTAAAGTTTRVRLQVARSARHRGFATLKARSGATTVSKRVLLTP